LVVAAGVAAIAYTYLSRRKSAQFAADPFAESDRRIDELEASLRRLQETFTQAVGT
jgi:hypothetical protein